MRNESMTILVSLAFAANCFAQDATLNTKPQHYNPTFATLAWNQSTAGDAAELDVASVGTLLQYSGVVLDGDGTDLSGPFLFLKVQQQNGDGQFEFAACYLGNNGVTGAFGLGFFALSQTFTTAHMAAARNGSSVTLQFTNVDGGTKPNQSYTCDGAPSPVGTYIGVNGYQDQTTRVYNFGDGFVTLDTFSYTGSLASSGLWNDVAPGMHAVNGYAEGGSKALSWYIGPTNFGQPTLSRIAPFFIGAGKTISVTLTGTNFVASETAINATSGIQVSSVSVISPTEITAQFTVATGTRPGLAKISVTTSAGTSNTLRFLVL